MKSGVRYQIGSRAGLLSGASMALAMLVSPAATFAQQAASTEAAGSEKEILVTGTRIVRDGYQAPTPTSVIGAQEIASKAATNIADFVNVLPSLASSSTPRNTISAVSAGNAGMNALNLRNLGINRTLVLLDGQRVGASSLQGFVDINQFPQALVKRVDIVTGGASADYGSDAVAGVVNFVLDKDFTGLKGEVQGGVTTYGDDRNYKVALTGGLRFADGRGHILLSGEAAYNAGVSGIGSRKWYTANKLFNNPAYTATNGQPQLITRTGTGFVTIAPGGVIASGPLAGIYFGPGGTPSQLNLGSIVSAPFMTGGDWAYTDFGTQGDIDPRLVRQNLFFRGSFDVTDNLQLFAQLSYGRGTTRAEVLPQFNIANITIQRDNAFLPASVGARMDALGLTSFTLGTWNQDLGPIVFSSKRSSLRPVIGAQGDFTAFGSEWSWDAYGQKTIARSYVEADISITANYNAAIDSVRNANGVIVCRSTLTNPTNGCVPYNILGTGVASDAARDYVLGTSWSRLRITEDVAAANLRGNPFSTWAGPVSVAMGIEHRREKVRGTNDPSPPRSYFAGNFRASFGSYNVTEGYFATVVPLADNAAFAKKLDLSASIRATDYSTSGYVTTWKAGLNYSPVDDISFRVTRSRDIRAPNLAELFQANQTTTSTFPDPFRGNVTQSTFQVTGGNLNLKPEKADAWGLGVVVQPRFLPGFAASVDYYDVRIKGAIATVTAPTVVNQCFAGNTALCSQITRNASNVITSVAVIPINLSKLIARGLDFEASYRHDLGDISTSLDGNLTFRVLATRFLENYSNNGINKPTDTVGTNADGNALMSLPKWRYAATVGWDNAVIGANFTARGVSAGKYNTSYVECTSACPASTTSNMTIDDNHVPGAIYFDANFTYKFSKQAEAFLAIDNFTNKDPVQVAYGTSIGGAPLSVNPALYDVLGRTFRLGARFKM